MVLSGLLVMLYGMGFFWDIHSYSYFVVVQVFAGLFQSGGWPSVVAIVAKWFGHGKRGLVMGVWNAHTSVGNIMGAMVAGLVLKHGWGWSFLVPGFIMVVVGVVIYMVRLPVERVACIANEAMCTVESSIVMVLSGMRGYSF